MIEDCISSVSYQIETTILTTPERVWRALTQEIDRWWLSDFHVLAPDSTIELQLRPGGQLMEQHPETGELSWYAVQMYVLGQVARPHRTSLGRFWWAGVDHIELEVH